MKKLLGFSLIMLFVITTTNSLKAAVNPPDGNNSHFDFSKTSKVLADPADPIVKKPDDAQIRWADDKIIYDGQVYVNDWEALELGIDNDAIDVDYFAGDTLRAVVACPDSVVRIFRSNDNGLTWEYVHEIGFGFDNITEPKIVHGTDSTYHVFVRYLHNQDRLYTLAFKTSNDESILGTGQYVSGDDSVKNYSVCTNRRSFHDYSIFVAYHRGLGGRGEDQIMFSRTIDQGENWSAPTILQWRGSGFPDITYGNDNILYETFIFLPDTVGEEKNYNVYARRSLNFGGSWYGSELISLEDSFPKMGPQIAAAYDGSGDAWIIWPRQDLYTTYDDWGLRWSWSTDTGATWSSPAWVNSIPDSNEVLPSIAVNDAYNSISRNPQVSFIRCLHNWSGKLWVRSFYWEDGDNSWSLDSCRADSGAVATRPVAAFASAGTPAVAYVGENSENVYFDSWGNVPPGLEEDNDITVSNGQIECSLDCNVILGTTTLKYTLLKKTTVDISLVNILGQKVSSLESGEKDSGEHTISISAENLSQGIYYIVIETDKGQKGIAKAAVLK